MKDIKTFLIGFLSCACLFLFMGQTSSSNNLRDITVKSITLINDAGDDVMYLGSNEQGGFIGIKNNLNKQTTYLGTNSKGNGELSIWNVLQNQSLFLGATTSGDGRIVINDYLGNQNVFAGSKEGEGFVATTNSNMETTGSIPVYISK